MSEPRDLGPVVVQKRGLIRLGTARHLLDIDEGDTLHMWLEDGRIVLEPVDLVPRTERYLATPEWREGLIQALEDLKEGRVQRFNSAKALTEDLSQGDAD